MSERAGAGKWGVVAGALIIQLILGTVYGYSIFWEPLTAEVFPKIVLAADLDGLVREGLDVTKGKVVVVEDQVAFDKQKAVHQGYLKYAFSICILTFAIVMVIAGRVQDLKGPRLPAIIGGALLGIGFIIASFMRSPIVFYLAHAASIGAVALVLLMLCSVLLAKMPGDSIIAQHAPSAVLASVIVAGVVLANRYVGQVGEFDKLFLLWGTIGFFAGAGIGFAYVCPIAALVKWFPEHKGLVSGIAVAGFGGGAFLFKGQQVGALGFIKEHDVVPFFRVHGCICLVAVTLGALLLRNPPAAPTADKPGSPAADGETSDTTWQNTLRKPAFYLLWLMFFSGAMAGLMVIGIVKPFVTEQVASGGMSGTEAAAAGAAAVGYLAIFNALGRIVWGVVSDKIGRTTAFVMMFTIQAATMFALGSLSGPTALAVVAAVVGFNFGGNFALFPSATADLFGAKNLGANYGWVFTSYGIAGVVGVAAGNAAKVQTGSYGQAFIAAGVLCLLAAGCALLVRRLNPAPAAST